MAQSLNPSLNASLAVKRLMITLLGGAGLILLGGGGALLGLNSHLTRLQTIAEQKEQEVGSSEGVTKRFQVTEEAYTQTQSRIQYLEASVSPKSYVPTLLGQLQALAETTHLTVNAVRPAEPPPQAAVPAKPAAGSDDSADKDLKKAPPPPPYDTLNIAVDVTGTYPATAAFLYNLTRFPKIISVTGVQMHPDGVEKGASPYASPTVATSLRLTAFIFHDDGAAAPAMPNAVMPNATVSNAPLTQAVPTTGTVPDTIIPPASVGTISGAAGRAATGAVSATKAVNERSAARVGSL